MVLYGGGIIAWESTRQAFTTLSTAEAELTGYVQATAVGEHLRCRAGRLAELIEEEEWRLRHLPGTLLAADGLTKPLAKIQFEKCRGGMGLEVIERKKVTKAFGEKVIEKVGAAGWLAVDKLKAVVGMLSLVAVAKAEDGEEPELEGVSLEVILTVIAILVVVIWELTKKACGLGMKKLKRPVEDPDKELARPHEEAKSPPKETAEGGSVNINVANRKKGQVVGVDRATGSSRDKDLGTDNTGTGTRPWTGVPLPKQAPKSLKAIRPQAKASRDDLVVVCHVRDGTGGRVPVRATRAVLGTERMEYYREMERKSEERWEFLQARARGEPLGGLQGSLWRADEHLRGGPIEVVETRSQPAGQSSGEGGSAGPSKDVKEEETQPRGSSCTARAAAAGKVVLREDKE